MAAETFRFESSWLKGGEQTLERDGSDHGLSLDSLDHNPTSPYEPSPVLFHKVEHDRSILALAVIDSNLFAGTQGGEVVVSRKLRFGTGTSTKFDS